MQLQTTRNQELFPMFNSLLPSTHICRHTRPYVPSCFFWFDTRCQKARHALSHMQFSIRDQNHNHLHKGCLQSRSETRAHTQVWANPTENGQQENFYFGQLWSPRLAHHSNILSGTETEKRFLDILYSPMGRVPMDLLSVQAWKEDCQTHAKTNGKLEKDFWYLKCEL